VLPDPVSSIMIRSVALLAVSAVCLLKAVNVVRAPLAVYYSFDISPPVSLFTKMQSELGQILAPAGLHVTWRAAGGQSGGEDFPEIVVFHFHGQCFFDGRLATGGPGSDPGRLTLGETELTDGRVLSFATVNCDAVRRLIAPAERSAGSEDRNAVLGRALARVSAHEIYHMLTRSETHAGRGIARSTHSSAELTASTFKFAKPETNWLRGWVEKRAPMPPAIIASVSTGQPSGERKSASLAGR
jgi:hypothetical protein